MNFYLFFVKKFYKNTTRLQREELSRSNYLYHAFGNFLLRELKAFNVKTQPRVYFNALRSLYENGPSPKCLSLEEMLLYIEFEELLMTVIE